MNLFDNKQILKISEHLTYESYLRNILICVCEALVSYQNTEMISLEPQWSYIVVKAGAMIILLC